MELGVVLTDGATLLLAVALAVAVELADGGTEPEGDALDDSVALAVGEGDSIPGQSPLTSLIQTGVGVGLPPVPTQLAFRTTNQSFSSSTGSITKAAPYQPVGI